MVFDFYYDSGDSTLSDSQCPLLFAQTSINMKIISLLLVVHRGIQRRTLEPPTATPNQISTLRFNRGLSTQPDIEELIVPPPGQPLPGLSMNTSEYMVLARPPAQVGTRIRDHRSQDIVVVVPEAVQ